MEFKNKKSKSNWVKEGARQGKFFSQILFTWNVSELLAAVEEVEFIIYTDECAILTTGHDIDCSYVVGLNVM